MLIIPTIYRTMYRAFGLRLSSDIRLPELYQEDTREQQEDISIAIGDLSGMKEEFDGHQTYYLVKDRQIFFYIPDTAILAVKGGNHITVSPLPGSDENFIRLYVLGSCMGTVLMQRQILPLHGSAVVIDGKAYAFVGESGAGKSTLAAAFLQRGYRLASDDVIAVTIREDGVPVVTPSYPQQKLWQESLIGLGMEAGGYNHLCREVDKFAVPVAAQFHTDAIPLAGVFELIPADKESGIQCLTGLEPFPLLTAHTYRNFLIRMLQMEQWHFTMLARIIGKVDTYQLFRPLAGFTAHDLSEQIIGIVTKGR